LPRMVKKSQSIFLNKKIKKFETRYRVSARVSGRSLYLVTVYGTWRLT
jgi:hypothetical protein